ncbi:MAG: minor capsid protein [Clostridia bacterium]
MDKMGVGAMQARRLVRTESCYVANQAEMESYRECEIDKYRFVATLDLRTSEICATLDGKEFPVDKEQLGVNCPPMHPNCRSTTIAVFDKKIMDKMRRRAIDPETGEDVFVPANMDYAEWKKKFANEKTKGLAAKNSDDAFGGKPEVIDKIDFGNKDVIAKTLDDAEHKYSSLDYEVCCTVTKDGRVWETKELTGSVHPEQIETIENGVLLKGSYLYHNHPAEQTHFSFGADDIAFFMEKEIEISYASDYKYSYSLKRTKDALKIVGDDVVARFKEVYNNDIYEMAFSKGLDIDEDGFHEAVKALSKHYNFEYERRLKDGR